MPLPVTQPPPPAGPYTMPLAALASMVAETWAFQTWCGLAYPDPDAELKLVSGDGGWKRIWYPALDNIDYLKVLPAAILSFGAEWQLTPVAGGARTYFHGPRGEITLELVDLARHANRESAARDFGNFLGQLLDSNDETRPGLAQLAALDDRLAIAEFVQLAEPAECERIEGEANEQLYWSARIAIRYGLAS